MIHSWNYCLLSNCADCIKVTVQGLLSSLALSLFLSLSSTHRPRIIKHSPPFQAIHYIDYVLWLLVARPSINNVTIWALAVQSLC